MFAGARFAALYDGTDWASAIAADGTPIASVSGGASNPTGDTLSTQLTAVANSNSSACGTSSDAVTKTTAMKYQLAQLRDLAVAMVDNPTTYKTIDPKNSYRLVSYQYAGTSGQMPNGTAIGRLVVEGKSSDGGSESVSRIMVDIPISGAATAALPGGTTFPGLWLKEEGLAHGSDPTNLTANTGGNPLGNQRYDSNVAFSDCGTSKISNNGGYEAYLNNGTSGVLFSGRKAEFPSVAMPSIPAEPSIPSGQQLSSIENDLTLPRKDVDTPIGGVYYYKVAGNITLSGNKQLTITPGEKVVIYLYGNITASGNGGIVHTCSNGVTDCGTDFIIYGKSTASNPSICVNGGGNSGALQAFILAPTYGAGLNGGGASDPQFQGSFWVKSWSKACGSSSNKIAVRQNQTWASVPSNATPASVPLPTIASFSGWSQIGTDVDVANIPSPPAYTGPYLTAASNTEDINNEDINNEDTNNEDTNNEEQKCTMPNLVGTSTTGKTATTLLNAVKAALTGFTGTPTGTANTSGASDTILTQTPAAGSVDCGTAVSYTYKLPTPVTIDVNNQNDCTALSGTYYHSGNVKTCTYYP
jgi:hypothetical protein